MYKRTITYTDYNGTERSETFYFNFSKAELAELQLSTDGGLENYIQRIVEAQDTKELIKVFKDLILRSYGEKTDDGKRFIKSKELSEAFSQTEAYSELFMALATDDKLAAEFINGILPSDLQEEMAKAQQTVRLPSVN